MLSDVQFSPSSNSLLAPLSISDDYIQWRQERDLNSRVQGTVDFESTAIPSYAILASMCPLLRDGHKDDALSNRYAGAVKRT